VTITVTGATSTVERIKKRGMERRKKKRKLLVKGSVRGQW
jgi:hypothetical protein